jgi:thymidylate kinase
VESGSKLKPPIPVNVKANVARVLLDALSTQCKSYCFLSGYDRLPHEFDTDIDFMVGQEDFQRMPRIIEEVGRRTGTHLFQAVDHELTGRAYFLGSIDGPSLTIVQPDCASDYRHFGRHWLSAEEVLAARRLHPNGFYIPSTAHEFAYCLIKCLNTRIFTREHGYNLHRLYVEDRIECGRMIARFCRGPEGSSIVRMASANQWTPMYESLDTFRAAMLASGKETLARRLKSVPQSALYLLSGIVQPTGCWIAFLGPDGCGKSLILDAIGREFASAFHTVSYDQMRPGGGRRSSNQGLINDPNGEPPLGRLAFIAKVIGMWLDYMLGYLLRILPGVFRTQLIFLDRCQLDLLVDGMLLRNGGSPWLLRATVRLSPRPDLVIFFDAPPEVLRSRTQEVPIDEVARQRAAYLQLAQRLPSSVVVNAAQSQSGMIHDTVQAIVAHLSARAKRRLHLPAPTGRGSQADAISSGPLR